jgi:predicted metal-dependent hydrolase
MSILIDHLIHSRRKTLALIVQRDGSLTVRAPMRMSASNIEEFVQSHAEWIQEKQAHAKAAPPPPKKDYVDGETFLFLGREYPLLIVLHQRSALTFTSSSFHLSKSSLPNARQVFIRWYKAQALGLISERIAFHGNKSKFPWQKIRITSARTRWGSCSTNGTLSFSWRLALAPPDVIDYVVVHEMVHTRIRNHSAKFWNRVAEILPEYKRYVTWLKKNGRFLTLDEV